MKVVFINTPTQLYPEEGRKDLYTTMPPFGLGYVATAVANLVGRENVELIDGEALGLSPKSLAKKVIDLKPDYMGINIFSPNYDIAQMIIENLGPTLGRNIIVGGTHVILDPESVLKNKRISQYIKFAVTGEGELPILEFLAGTPLRDILGIGYMDGEKVFLKSGWEMNTEQLNELILDHSFFINDPNRWKDGKTIESYLLSSRGCSYDCYFCAAKQISGRHVRMRSPLSLKRELEQELNRGVNYIRFMDDLLLISQKRINQLRDVFKELGLNKQNFGFEANGRANIMSKFPDEAWDLLVEMGLNELEIGIESGSERILDIMNKKVLLEQVVQTVKKASERGIGVKGFLMVGYLGETNEDLEATIRLVEELKEIAGPKIRFSPVPVKAYPGTQLYLQTQEVLSDLGVLLPQDQPINVAEIYRQRLDAQQYEMILNRTRYNAIPVDNNGSPVTLSSLVEGGATSDEVLWALCQLILISEGRPTQIESHHHLGKERY